MSAKPQGNHRENGSASSFSGRDETRGAYSRMFMSGAYKLPLILGLFISAFGLVVIIGWFSHVRLFVQLTPALVPVQFNTGLCFFLSGLALALISCRRRKVAIFAAAPALVIGILTLAEHIGGADLGLDELFVKDWIKTLTSSPGKPTGTPKVS